MLPGKAHAGRVWNFPSWAKDILSNPGDKLMTLRIGMVGAGKTAFKIARRLAAYPDVKIVAVADHSRPERDLFTKTFGCPLSTGDYERLILNSSVDVIYIA
ncbi:MAG TPA: hypothetical protein DCL60_09320, partial [Armatimonadetes bacterium]|nr:hypothetical protein [Armatimonadota bacterium]